MTEPKEAYERKKCFEGIHFVAHPCIDRRVRIVCTIGTALSRGRGQDPRRIERMVAGARESTHRCAERGVDSDRRCGLRRLRNFRWTDPDAHLRQPRQQWVAL